MENYSITYLTSGRDLLRLQVRIERDAATVVVADPLYDLVAPRAAKPRTDRSSDENRRSVDFTMLNYKPLPGTSDEAAAVNKLWPDAQLLTQEKATEDAVKQVRSPRLLHIATHGFFLPDQPPALPSDNRSLETSDTVGTSARFMS